MRTWVYEQLHGLEEAGGFLGGVHENTALDTVPAKPFVVYSMGTSIPELQDGNESIALNSTVTIWVHSDPGDYIPIDEALTLIRQTLEVNTDGVIAARFITESDDLRDPEMGTIMRYSRFQLVHTPLEV